MPEMVYDHVAARQAEVSVMDRVEDRETRVRQTRWQTTAADLEQVASLLAGQLEAIGLVHDLRAIRTEAVWVVEQNRWQISVLAEGSSSQDMMMPPVAMVVSASE